MSAILKGKELEFEFREEQGAKVGSKCQTYKISFLGVFRYDERMDGDIKW